MCPMVAKRRQLANLGELCQAMFTKEMDRRCLPNPSPALPKHRGGSKAECCIVVGWVQPTGSIVPT